MPVEHMHTHSHTAQHSPATRQKGGSFFHHTGHLVCHWISQLNGVCAALSVCLFVLCPSVVGNSSWGKAARHRSATWERSWWMDQRRTVSMLESDKAGPCHTGGSDLLSGLYTGLGLS